MKLSERIGVTLGVGDAKMKKALLSTTMAWVLALGLPVSAAAGEAEPAAQPPAQPVSAEGRPLDAVAMAALGITESAATEAARTVRPDSGTWSWTPGQYSYDGSGNITAIGTEASFLYDVTGRLVDADLTRAGVTEHREYDYDPFGNRTSMTVGSTSIPTATSTATNHLTGLSALYDAAGNVTQLQPPGQSTIYQQKFDPLGSLQEVKASNISGAQPVLYIYTADDERLWTFDLAANASHWKIRDLDGKVLRDYYVPGTTWTLSRDYVYREGSLLAAVTPTETLHFSLDHLGTPRVITRADRNRVGFHYYFPFGEEWTDQSGAQEGEPMKFTAHERDADVVSGGTNGFDYMHARYYAPNVGRFLSIDPVISKAAARAPQLWNRYSYAGNNPIRFVDPDGRQLIFSACIRDQSSDACHNQMNLYLSTFGIQAAEAAKYLRVGKNGVVSFTGISGAGFAARFGLMGRATNYLVSNLTAKFTMTSERNDLTDKHKGGYSDVYKGPGGTFGIDPSRFPTKDGYFGMTQTAAGALVHEIGHAIASLIPGFAEDLQLRKGKSHGMKAGSTYEGYSTAFENAWRHEVLGVGPSEIRSGYYVDGDIYDSKASEMYPP